MMNTFFIALATSPHGKAHFFVVRDTKYAKLTDYNSKVII